jgi:6-pyruvoyltetrahydropterin/6-carboxytetrahydropterin synthase
MIEITRKVEFDAGHRIPNHTGQCRHLHGHRYQLEVTVAGDLNEVSGDSAEGMLIDFGEIKTIANKHLVEKWDHAFLVAQFDTPILDFLASIPDHKTVVLESVPTVENLAKNAFEILAPLIKSNFKNRIYLSKIRLYETPNCWAEVVNAE